jgi:malate synthase
MAQREIHPGVKFSDRYWNQDYQNLFPFELIILLKKLHHKFEERRLSLLHERKERQCLFDSGDLPAYLTKDSQAIRGDWKISTIPSELLRRRVEITGPVNSTKMVINMLSRNEHGDRADMAMLDFEDSMKPTFRNVLNGFKNVIGAVSGDLSYSTGKKNYTLNPKDKAYVMVRVRGLHLSESNVKIDGQKLSAGLFDLAVTFYHTARLYLQEGLTPKYYVPKCEHFLEARWWSDLFKELESSMGLPTPTLRTTFLIETLPATFQVEEILYEIRTHAVGLNVGRWDKIFSDIKVLRNHSDRVLPDRALITMERPWMENYAKRVIKICHDRGAFAMGGMAAFTPGKTSEEREEQTRKVLFDKSREAQWGHDGCWVSHPYFIGVALKAMSFENQLHRKLDFDKYPDLIPKGSGPYTVKGLRTNVRVGIAYMYGWQTDLGCIALDNLMEDLATLEISRAQTWQWLRHGVVLDDGTKVTQELLLKVFDEEYERLLHEYQEEPHSFLEQDFKEARNAAYALFAADELQDFLTLENEEV